MKTLRLFAILFLFLLAPPLWAQQTISGTIIRSGTAPLSALGPSGATVNQVPEWSGAAWIPSTLAAGGGLSLNFSGGSFTISLSTPVSAANGGTGQSSYTDGQLLIGDSSSGGLDKATLTAGSNITITNGHGSITIASSGGGSGNPTVAASVGAGATYSLTQSYANTSIAPASITSGDTYRITATVNFTDTVAGDELRAFLYDSTAGYMIPWSEQRVTSSPISTAPTPPPAHALCTLDAIYTAPGNDTVQVWASNPTSARGTVLTWPTRINVEQVSASSSQTQQSNSDPVSGAVSDYNAASITGVSNGGNVSSWPDNGSANLALSAGATEPTLQDNAWNGQPGVVFSSSTTAMATSSVPTSSTSAFTMFMVLQAPTQTGHNLFTNGNGNGYGFEEASSAEEVQANFQGTTTFGATGLVPLNGYFLLTLERSSGTTTFYLNGVSVGTSTSSPSTPTTNMNVGNDLGTTILRMKLYSTALSSTNLTAETNYLISLYGL